jgi:hypothetical protein
VWCPRRVSLEGLLGGASAVLTTALSIPKEGVLAMLRGLTLPGTLSRVLDIFRPCFTAPTFETFTALVAGLVAQSAEQTVCGMLTRGWSGPVWHHCRAHRSSPRRGGAHSR